MKNLHLSYIAPRASFVTLICLILCLAGCSSLVSSLDQYSGETLYENAVKSNGDLLAFAPDIRSEVYQHLDTSTKRKQFQAFQRDLITKIIKQNPRFAKEFYNKMHSQDREKINQALTDAGLLLEKELQHFTGKDEVTARNVVNAVLQKYRDV